MSIISKYKIMKNKSVFIILALTASVGLTASFDCGKAKTHHEKFICSNPQLDALDKQLGESYSNANKNFVLKGYIPAIHKSWLSSYRVCAGTDKVKKEPTEALRNCSEEVAKRIELYGNLVKGTVYTDFEGRNWNQDDATFIIFEKDQSKFLRYFGGWMPSNMDPDKMKGFPFDGSWCDNAMQLKKKGLAYTIQDGANDDGYSDDFEVKISEKTLIIKGSINCGPRSSIGNGKFDRK